MGWTRRRWPLLAALVATGLWFWRCLPEPLFSAPLSYSLHAADGQLLAARIAADGQWRLAPASAVPQRFAEALVQFEDRRFYGHFGLDPIAIARALRSNWRQGRVVSGASTISLQTARLMRPQAARNWREKLREALWALRLEAGYSKPEILALYASNAPFGGNVVGLDAAAWRYFGRSAAALSWAEAATLAVLPNSPALIHLGRARPKLLAKRNRLLARLLAAGKLSKLDYQLALQEGMPEAPKPLPKSAPHLLDTLASKGRTQGAIHSTIDAGLQAEVNAVLHARGQRLAAQGVRNLAALVVDHSSMQVRAYAGNRLARDPEATGLAVDIIRRPRSTGSVLKPMLYAAMLQQGLIQPSSLVPDVPTQFDGFRPENFDRSFRGATTAKAALAASLNVPAVALLRQYGQPRFYDLLRRMGVTSLTKPADHYGLTLILGGAEASLWDLTGLYANLARAAASGAGQGRLQSLGLQLLQDAAPAKGPVLDFGAGAAWLTLDALEEVSRPEDEVHWRNFASSRRLAWKTGTSHGLRDGWAFGVSRKHTIAVWVGNASGEGVAGLTGTGMAAPILFDIAKLLGEHNWFAEPLGDLKSIEVCADDGYLPAAGCATSAVRIPAQAHFQRVSRNHQLLHLDAQGLRADSRCADPAELRAVPWLVLPPSQEAYYRQHHLDYRSPPPWRAECRAIAAAAQAEASFEIVVPDAGAKLYLPEDLGGTRGKVLLQASHRRPDAGLYWHVDAHFVGETQSFHNLSLELEAGPHTLTVVDAQGFSQRRSFEVLPSSR